MTARLAWLTDLHLNFVTDEYRVAQLVEDIEASGVDAVLIGGDTGESHDFAMHLEGLAANLQKPIYFVLGNHDYYHGSIEGVRRTATSLSQISDELTWLPEGGVIEISDQTALVGHGGWGDARVGDFMASTVSLNDYLLIEELQATHRFPESDLILTEDLKAKLHSLGDEAALFFRRILPEAFQNHDEVVVLTHVPPFHEACWHEGNLSDLNWSPHFVCQAVGEVLLEHMKDATDKRMTVLCGHTHSSGEVSMLDNLLVKTGSATYREPRLQEVVTCE